jgi:hypothetical protein
MILCVEVRDCTESRLYVSSDDFRLILLDLVDGEVEEEEVLEIT